jgi:signal transduction histidine kinase
MRRLYLQIYLAFLGVLLLFALLAALAWWLVPDDGQQQRHLDGLAALVAQSLPAPEQRTGLQRRLEELAARFDSDLTLRAADGALLAAVGEELRAAPPRWTGSGWLRGRGGPRLALRLPDGRWLLVRLRHRHRATGLLMALAALAGAVGLGAYPLARRITRRVERLQTRVEALGAGDLKARVEIEGRDEVAELARSFNQAAGRIEQLVGAHKTLLAHVSHELRTPLTRMRMALELLSGEDRPELKARLAKDIGELDGLIGELLLASRLDTLEGLIAPQDVELLALAAEEAAEHGAEVGGEPVTIRGDARLLQRLLRNLLQNARRYADGSAVEVTVQALGGGARLRVADRGPGVPEAERERIFEPFYRPAGAAETGEGAGLGLALVRQIAQRHGGTARCLAREGGGTVFEIDLPGIGG